VDAIAIANESDAITLDVDTGKTLSVVVEPAAGLIAEVEAAHSTAGVLGIASSAAAGESASVALRTVSDAQLEIYDESGVLLAAGMPRVDSSHFIAN